MAVFDDLPTELILQILTSLPIRDVLNASRTSHYLRYVSLNFRGIWRDASDSYRLPLPTGYTIASVRTIALPSLAVRALSLKAALADPEAPRLPKSYRAVKELDPPFQGHPEFVCAIPGNEWVILALHCDTDDNLHLVLYSLETSKYAIICPSLKPWNSTCALDATVRDDGILFACIGPSKNENSCISVFTLRLPKRDEEDILPTVTLKWQMPCHTDTISVSKISLRGSLLVCLSKRQNMLVINWENNTGISYTNTGNSNGWELTGPWEAYIHPHLPLIICTIEEHHPDAHSPNWSRRKVCVVDVPHELPPLRKTITDISLSSEEFPYASSALLPDDLGVPVPWFDLRERTPNLSSLSIPICSMHNSWGLNRDEMVSPRFNLSGDSMSVQARIFCAKMTSVWMVGGSQSNPIHRTLAYQPPLPDIYKPFLPDPIIQSDGLRWTRVLIPPELRMQRENWPENTSLPYRFEVVGVDLAYGGFYVERYNDSLSAPDRCLYCIQY